ncbi:unnamed protein product [Ambrosiozyma monospora]|uniref:Unnamed protein product n=1 Tax=Ambrosiozyma monospora TaxID=43982 RepID=A0A9W6TAR9_AMBMO|nr:unnamed protein product [Ambrosiozyma monospora]
MPAMSPTMDEGGVVAWHVKEGAEFASGDLLLEVETDKATIAVEAQDDGIMAKILKNDGATNVRVGAPIAILAEPGDNIADLDLAKLEAEAAAQTNAAPAPKAEEAAPTPAPEPTPASTPAESAPTPSSAGSFTGGKPNPSQVFFPSVDILLHENGVSREDALANITATGPNALLHLLTLNHTWICPILN